MCIPNLWEDRELETTQGLEQRCYRSRDPGSYVHTERIPATMENRYPCISAILIKITLIVLPAGEDVDFPMCFVCIHQEKCIWRVLTVQFPKWKQTSVLVSAFMQRYTVLYYTIILKNCRLWCQHGWLLQTCCWLKEADETTYCSAVLCTESFELGKINHVGRSLVIGNCSI